MLRFEGYAAIFDVVDRGGDVVRTGAFGDVAPVPLLREHRGPPVGTIDAIGEDGVGLKVAGRIDDAAAAAQVRAGVLGLSFGFRAGRTRHGTYRELIAVTLIEVSLVLRPMQPGARIVAIADPEIFNEGADHG